jgi:glycine cleavage system regulatory protein
MKYEEIIKLLDAGYSRDGILAMKEETAPAADPTEPEPAPEPVPAADITAGIMEEVKGMFAEMKKELEELKAQLADVGITLKIS